MVGARANGDPRFALLVALLCDTGARKGEILGRRWSEFDTERGEVVVEKTKTDRPRVLFFTPDTAALIERLRPRGEAAEALALAGRPELHMHDLRHAVAARLLRAPVLPLAWRRRCSGMAWTC